MLENLGEILATMRRNKLRAALTAIAVAWGIFLLVCLQAAGVGLRQAVTSSFSNEAKNSLFIHGGQTSLPYNGRGPGRQIQLTNRDYDVLASFPGVTRISGRQYFRGVTVKTATKTGAFTTWAVHADHRDLELTLMLEGRFINETDVATRRKVTVIGREVREFLFGKSPAIGRYVTIGGVHFQVVGVSTDEGREGELRTLYIPVSTAQRTFNTGEKLDAILVMFGSSGFAESKSIEQRIVRVLAERHDFSSNDPRALRTRDTMTQANEFSQLFFGIDAMLYIVGFGTLVAGIVGVSNIMLISTAERTHEFGIRKAIGATPFSIIASVIGESILVTSVAGYVGLLAGVTVVEIANALIPANDMFMNPRIHFGTAVLATSVLVVFGAIAGYVPAARAANTDPMVALRCK